MRANILFKQGFTIPKNLPHRCPTAEGEATDNIFGDWVAPSSDGAALVLGSRRGSTRFDSFSDEGNRYVVPAGTRASFEGARQALNAVTGVEFPECEVTEVNSTLGWFPTLEDYDSAREAHHIGKVLLAGFGMEAIRALARIASHKPDEGLESAQFWGNLRDLAQLRGCAEGAEEVATAIYNGMLGRKDAAEQLREELDRQGEALAAAIG